ncbi:AAA family ATPase [Niameybacter massiliensis]|uniref:endopeptidase La n=1 Tax=Holtiella tumoricola TaxID=3018743 RepID=A0AA42DRV3_9FIRM|nr:ATP-binding protein [Holtiella tumoricola]MDA3734234.1 AAA family ATPase [Holtiella tumoricola]
MKNNLELKWEELKIPYTNTGITFSTTDEIKADESIIDQENALATLEFGLQLGAKGYNMYISGSDQKTIFDYVLGRLKDKATKRNVPPDMCYIYNFENPSTPKVIWMQPGDGIRFKNDMKEFKQFLINELKDRLDTLEAEKKRQKLITELDEKKEEALAELKTYAKDMGFQVKMAEEGLGFIPLTLEGKPLSMDAYEKLDDADKHTIEEVIDQLSEFSEEVLKKVRDIEKLYSQYMDDIDETIVLNEVGYYMKYLKDTYGSYDEVSQYLDDIANDILEDVSIFAGNSNSEGQDIKGLLPWLGNSGVSEKVNHYSINVLVDNGGLKGAPIITSRDLSQGHLVGKIRIDTEVTTSHTDFNQISAGMLHQANGGYLLLYVKDLLDYPGSFDLIRRTLKTGEVNIESMGGGNNTNTIGITPQPIPVDFKVILVGDYEIYHLLTEMDLSFKDLFKINIDFKDTITSGEVAIMNIASQIKSLCNKEDLPPVSCDGILQLVEYSHRLAESQEKMSANLQPIMDLVREASVFAQGTITKDNIIQARRMKMLFKDTLQKNIEEKYAKNIFLVDVMGKKVGQINGLAVYSVGDFSFGRPVRITATTYRGKSGVVDIEGAVGLSGSIHSKGVQIITGFLGNHFAQNYPLSLCGKICFEQSYGGVDGDSASSAELYAILSSLSEVPLRQGIAVTGSINQYGQIQPVGGINDKIEGFYRVCKQKGLTGKQGVMIPDQNKGDLVLDEEVIKAVEQGKFHIYAITSFREGIEVLTGVPAAQVEERVAHKLKIYSVDSPEKLSRLKKQKVKKSK